MTKEETGNAGKPDGAAILCTFTVDARPDVVRDVRHQVEELARQMPFTDQDIEDIKLAVGEATTNAIRYGSPCGERSHVMIRCEQMRDRLIIEIADEGCGFDLESSICSTPQSFDDHGRGLFFMKLLMDDVSVECGSGATVRMEKRLNTVRGKDPQDRS